jgi:N6-adenosine-specific RNA methylase IME4
LTWCKPSIGVGNYFRNNTEHVLFGIRGSLPVTHQDIGTWFEAPRGPDGHSSKPEAFYALVRRASPGPRAEWFGKHDREGFVQRLPAVEL